MEPDLFRYIWRHSRREQLVLFGLVGLGLPFYFFSLELPKRIVNGIEAAMDGAGPAERFLSIPSPFGGGPVFEGFDLGVVGHHVALSLVFLALVLVNGTIKFVINMRKGQMGERMLRRLRFQLLDRVLRFPTTYFRRLRPSEVASMVKDEVEPLGGFIGSAFVQPLYQGGLALTATIFILVQNFSLGLVAITVVLAQVFIIPRLRAPILELGKRRQLAARDLAGHVGELVGGVAEVRAHDTSNYERAELSARLGKIYDIRHEIYRRKFFVKFLNNFLAQIPLFVFLGAGGYFVLRGSLDIGQLVAVIAAYKDLPPPIRELINWDQQRLDIQIKYDQVVEQFNPAGMLPAELQQAEYKPPPGTPETVSANNVTVIDETGATLLDCASFAIEPGERIAVLGTPGGGKEYLGPLLLRLIEPLSGRVRIGREDLAAMPESIVGRRFAFLGQDAYLFPGSVRDNLVYALKHAPPPGSARSERHSAVLEALRSGNSPHDPAEDWIDYEAAGVAGPQELEARLPRLLETVDLREDVYRLGLRGRLDPARDSALCPRLLGARRMMRRRLEADGDHDLVEPFDSHRYNQNATLAENILFGTPRDAAVTLRDLIAGPEVGRLLERAGLRDDLVRMGGEIARIMVDLFSGLPADHPFFEQFGFIAAADLPHYQALTNRAARDGPAALDEAARQDLLVLTFDYVEARHRLGLVDEEMEKRVVAARRLIMTELPREVLESIEFMDPERFSFSLPVQDNVLFGRIAYGQAGSETRIAALMGEVLEQLDLRAAVLRVGLDFDVGSGGKRLSVAQRQKIGLARALLKRPQLLIVNAGLAVLDTPSQSRVVANVLSFDPAMSIIWVLGRADYADAFDRIWTLERGRIVSDEVQRRPAPPVSVAAAVRSADPPRAGRSS